MLKRWLKLLRTAVLIVGVLLSFFAVVELARAYQTLRGFHPAAGYAMLAVLGAALLWLLVWIARTMLWHPPVLRAPAVGDLAAASGRVRRRYARYLVRYMRRLGGNPQLADEARAQARAGAKALAEVVDAGGKSELLDAICRAEAETVEPLLAGLGEQADARIRSSVRDVMVGVAFSPYKAADLLIVLYRNTAMVLQIVRVYHARPRLPQQFAILRDTLRVVATVNFINLGKNILEGLLSKLPGGRFLDDIAQGVGAGFMTSVAGHAAMARCRAFRRWDQEAAAETLRGKMGEFFSDVKSIFMKDLLGQMTGRLAGGGLAKVTVGNVGAALDAAGDGITRAAGSAGGGMKRTWGAVKRFIRSTEVDQEAAEPDAPEGGEES